MLNNSKSPAQSINELPIIQQSGNMLISAKLLHKRLKSGYQFSDWLKRRAKEYGFVENVDFFASDISEAKRKRGGHNAVDYLLTLDTAKELAMLEKNEVGRAIRRYFIQKEKESRMGILPKETEIFSGIKGITMNGRKMYPFRTFLREKLNYSKTSTGSYYRVAYANHFIVMDKLIYVSEEMAIQIFHSRRLIAARKANKEMQPVLPFNFAEPVQIGGQNG